MWGRRGGRFSAHGLASFHKHYFLTFVSCPPGLTHTLQRNETGRRREWASPPGPAPSLLEAPPAPVSFQLPFPFLHGSPCSALPYNQPPSPSPCICCSVCVTHLLFCLKLPTSFIIDSSLSFQVSPLHGPTNCPML